MNSQSTRYIDEISRKNISVITIHGCVDPTYSSDVFFNCLIVDKNLEVNRYGQFHHTDLSLSEWIRSTIENEIHPDYEIFKHNNIYIIAEPLGLEDEVPYESDNDGRVSVPYGGFIRFYPEEN